MAARTDTSMTIRMNREVKQEAQEIFSALGMDMTTAINVFLRQAIYYRGFPFEVRLDMKENVFNELKGRQAVTSRGRGPALTAQAMPQDNV